MTPPPNPTPLHLPNEIILIIIRKYHELLESDVQNYVNFRRGLWLRDPHSNKPFPRLQALTDPVRDYSLYHEEFVLDDCVFWHQCWTYTAMRLVSRFTNMHTQWASSGEVDALVEKYTAAYALEHPQEFELQQPPHMDVMRRMLGNLRGRSVGVPTWAKFREANGKLPEGTQLLPWQSGYDKAAAYCCIHFNVREMPDVEVRGRVTAETRRFLSEHVRRPVRR